MVISYDQADKFQQAGIADPAEHDRRRTIRVAGTVIREADQTRTRVDDPKPTPATRCRIRGQENWPPSPGCSEF